jgi:hypothetical protein
MFCYDIFIRPSKLILCKAWEYIQYYEGVNSVVRLSSCSVVLSFSSDGTYNRFLTTHAVAMEISRTASKVPGRPECGLSKRSSFFKT